MQRSLVEPEDSDEEEVRWDAVNQVLGLIEQEGGGQGSIPHMQVLSILSRNPKLPLSVAKRFIETLDGDSRRGYPPGEERGGHS